MNTTYDQSHCIEVINRLLRGEISAIEAYSEVIHRFADEPEANQLKSIRDEHIWAVSRLRANVEEMGGDPDTSSGTWGVFVKTLQGTANLLGESSALGVLAQGEKHGRNDYEAALADDQVMADCKRMITMELLPRIDSHITTLVQLDEQ